MNQTLKILRILILVFVITILIGSSIYVFYGALPPVRDISIFVCIVIFIYGLLKSIAMFIDNQRNGKGEQWKPILLAIISIVVPILFIDLMDPILCRFQYCRTDIVWSLSDMIITNISIIIFFFVLLFGISSLTKKPETVSEPREIIYKKVAGIIAIGFILFVIWLLVQASIESAGRFK